MPKTLVGLIAVLGLVLMLALVGCQNSSEPERGEEETGEHSGGSESAGEQSGGSEESNEHEGGSESGEEGEESEESGTQFALDDTFDEVRAGARLVLSYDGNANAFTGAVENTTEATLNRVRVEVHLSNGIELGPTTPIDLAPGQSVEVTLAASDEPFTSWSAHPEVN